ncbi:MauE/DoxX family redox-associated membrane protein [Streptomyces sp. NPDC087512]|uniref:MauE/DoxX family redox-associated membrane protein n=1 Tax=Streptomyces sp. NPDC087512 TaxID=3155059 RepID=UPI003428D92B
MQYLAVGVRCLIGVVFLISFLTKVVRRNAVEDLVRSLRELRLLPTNGVRATALLITAAEGGIAVLLATPSSAVATLGLGAAALLLTVFAVGIGMTVRRGATAVCACFGTSTVPLGLRHIVRNSVLAGIAVAGIAASGSASATAWGPAVVAALSGLLTGVLFTRLDDLLALFSLPALPPTR